MLAELFGLAREHRATLENPRVSLQDPNAWNDLYGGHNESASGICVSPDKALSFPPVWQAVSLISGDIAKLPLYPYRRGDGDTRTVDNKHPAYYLVCRMANEELTAFDFWRNVMVHALIWNNAYVFIARNNRTDPVGLFNLLPDRTTIERKDGQCYYVTEVTFGDGRHKTVPIPSADVLHIRGLSVDGLAGVQLLEAARDSWGLGLAAQGFASKFFKHGVRVGGILELPIGTTPNNAKQLEEGFRKYHEGEENWFKTAILRDGAKFHSTSVAPNDGQMNETREQQVRDTARLFNLAPSRLGLADSVSYNSKTEDNQSYLDSTLSPWMAAICAQCWAKLLSANQQMADTHYFEHNTSSLLKMNQLLRSQSYAIGIRNGWMSPNEVRKAENMPPREDGQGDDFVDVKAANGAGGMKPGGVGDSGQNQNTGDSPATTPADAGNVSDSPQSGRSIELDRVVFNVASRARHKAKNSRAFLEWLDGNLASHRTEAIQQVGEDSIIDAIVTDLQQVASTATADQLPVHVDALMSLYESGVK